MDNKPYFFYSGIKELATTLSGKENIYLGIRPYGFHAGNKIPFVIYPMLLCEEMQRAGKIPAFTYYLFINDWEQDGFDDTKVNIKDFPFNVLPKNTTFQFTNYIPTGGSIVNHWEAIIIDNVSFVKDKFPSISLRCIRNSQMRDMAIMKDVVIKTIKDPNLVGDVLRHTTQKTIIEEPYGYCRAICPHCKSARTENKIINDDDIQINCPNCGLSRSYNYHLLNFWLYHKPLALPRIKIFNIDLCITGNDHYNEGDFISRQKLFKAYNLPVKMPRTLYTPTLYGRNGLPMGKSKGNYEDLDIKHLMKIVLSNPDCGRLDII